tara:strand:- start:4269 stop:5267 length:999 start_codon:yes stop_codon:yes gene_type:complete
MGVTQNRDKAAILRVAKQAAKDWGLGDNLEELGDCENIVYRTRRADGTNVIIRVTEPAHRSAEQIKQELDYVDFLKSEGMNVCLSIPDNNGERLRTYTDPHHKSQYLVCVTEYADGVTFNLNAHWNVAMAEKLGIMLARFCKASRKYPQTQTSRHSYFDNEHVKNALKYIPANHDVARREWKTAIEWAKSLPRTPENFGLCHTDMHIGNFHITADNRVNVFDFDDTCRNFYLYDAMILHIVDGLKDKNLTNPTIKEFQDIYLTAYANELGIKDIEKLKQDVINFERLRNIEMYAWVYMMGYDKNIDMIKKQDALNPNVPFDKRPPPNRGPKV